MNHNFQGGDSTQQGSYGSSDSQNFQYSRRVPSQPIPYQYQTQQPSQNVYPGNFNMNPGSFNIPSQPMVPNSGSYHTPTPPMYGQPPTFYQSQPFVQNQIPQPPQNVYGQPTRNNFGFSPHANRPSPRNPTPVLQRRFSSDNRERNVGKTNIFSPGRQGMFPSKKANPGNNQMKKSSNMIVPVRQQQQQQQQRKLQQPPFQQFGNTQIIPEKRQQQRRRRGGGGFQGSSVKSEVDQFQATQPYNTPKHHKRPDPHNVSKQRRSDLSDNSTSEPKKHKRKRKRKKVSPQSDYNIEELMAKRRKFTKIIQPVTEIKGLDTSSFLKNRRDANGRARGTAGYDTSSLLIPTDVYSGMSNVTKEYWSLKRCNMDKVLFFAIGGFYELFEDDANIAKKVLGLQVKRGMQTSYMLKAGVPLNSKDIFVKILVSRGYTVAIADQYDEGDRIVRKISNVITAGTIVDEEFVPDGCSNLLLSIYEKREAQTMRSNLGICLADCGKSQMIIAYLEDDQQRSKLQTLLREFVPSEMIFADKNLSDSTVKILRNLKKIKVMKIEDKKFPNIVSDFAPEFDFDQDKFAHYNTLVQRAVGGCMMYLRSMHKAEAILKYEKISDYTTFRSGFMKINGQCMKNLNLFTNSFGGQQGTLLDYFEKPYTSFGRDCLKNWIRYPLDNIKDIKDRHLAIEELMKISQIDELFKEAVNKIANVESNISFLFKFATSKNQRIRYYDFRHRDRIIQKYLNTLSALHRLNEFAVFMASNYRKSVNSSVMVSIIENVGNLAEVLRQFKTEHLREVLGSERKLEIPQSAMDDEVYDAIQRRKYGVLLEVEKIRATYLKIYASGEVFNDRASEAREANFVLKLPKSIKFSKSELLHEGFKGQDRKSCKTEEEKKRNVKLKDFRCYTTPGFKKLNVEMRKVEDDERKYLEHYLKNEFFQFAKNRKVFEKMIECFAKLDCLLCFVRTIDVNQEKPNYYLSKPRLDPNNGGCSFIAIANAYHPCIRKFNKNQPFVTNNFLIGGITNMASIVLTGPNMGGKSTMMRTVCMCQILCQMGMYVPAKKMMCTLVDQIFTRIGANDQICAGESTFNIEMRETATILKEATSRSLVILDELGRGTSTKDGERIANAVVRKITEDNKSLLIFATHMHPLVRELELYPYVAFYKMAYKFVKNAEDTGQQIVNLYEYQKGICRKSFGIEVARLAKLPERVIEDGRKYAKAKLKEMLENENLSFYGREQVKGFQIAKNFRNFDPRNGANLEQNRRNMVNVMQQFNVFPPRPFIQQNNNNGNGKNELIM